MTSEYRHIPVLLTECIDALDLPDHPVFVDADEVDLGLFYS